MDSAPPEGLSGSVDFLASGIETIEEFQVTDADADGNAAFFKACKFLKIAEGRFPGFVDFSDSGIEKVQNLHITRGNAAGMRADFTNCPKLRTFRKEW